MACQLGKHPDLGSKSLHIGVLDVGRESILICVCCLQLRSEWPERTKDLSSKSWDLGGVKKEGILNHRRNQLG